MRKFAVVVVHLLMLSVLVTSCAIAGVRYSVTNLGTLGGDTRAHAINDNGWIVGASGWKSVLWHDGQMIDLTTRYNIVDTFSINNSNRIAGRITGSYRAATVQGDQLIDIGTLNTARVYSCVINDSGALAGILINPTNFYAHAFRWDGTTTDLGLAAGYEISEATDINSSGVVSGNCSSDFDYTLACIWEGNTCRRLGSLPYYSYGKAQGLNDKGQVVGYCFRDPYAVDDAQRPFIWQNGTLTDIGTLGGIRGIANDVNDLGEVVGNSTYFGSSSDKAFYWKNGQIVDLNGLIAPGSGWDLQYANSINNSGQIVGYGMLNGQQRAFLLTPVPEPSSLLTLLCGVGGVGGLLLRRRK